MSLNHICTSYTVLKMKKECFYDTAQLGIDPYISSLRAEKPLIMVP